MSRRSRRARRAKVNLKRALRYFYYRCVRLHGKPKEVAAGMAIGIFVGLTPTMGFQMVIAVPIAALMGQSKLAAAIGVWISNPVTAPILYGITYAVGAVTLGQPLAPPDGFANTFSDLSALSSNIFWPLWVGGLVLSVPLVPFTYWGTYQGVIAYRLQRRRLRSQRGHRWAWNKDKGWLREKVNEITHRKDNDR